MTDEEEKDLLEWYKTFKVWFENHPKFYINEEEETLIDDTEKMLARQGHYI